MWKDNFHSANLPFYSQPNQEENLSLKTSESEGDLRLFSPSNINVKMYFVF